MAIAKRVSNSGSAGGNGMSKIDVHNELAREERELSKEHRGWDSCCGNGCDYRMSKHQYTFEQSYDLGLWLRAGNCPTCNGWKNPEVLKSMSSMKEYIFVVEGVEFNVLRVPRGYRRKKIIKIETEEK